MKNKQRNFADDGWAIWVDGDDTSTVYINDWLNPKGKSYVDLAIRIRGIKASRSLHVYVPFKLNKNEIEDVSLRFNDRNILHATFSAACIVDYMKNEHTSELAYNGKTIDIVHVSTLDYQIVELAKGTHITIDLENLRPFLENDESYFIWRMPHKSLDEVFKSKVNVGNVLTRLRDLIMSPVVSEKFGYSIRINESRLLPEEITKIGVFHRQKLKKAVITLSVSEDYEMNDSGCYRIRRLEEGLYKEYLPKDYKCDDIITYQWQQNRDYDLKGHFNFYYSIVKNSISKASMIIYMILLISVGILSDVLSEFVKMFIGMA